MVMSRTTVCSGCGAVIPLVLKPGDPARLQGVCSCSGRVRAVFETDNPDHFSDLEMLEPAERIPKRVRENSEASEWKRSHKIND